MAKKTIGYAKLQWTCPNCKTVNPGPEKLCLSCGSPQPENVEFEDSKSRELIQDEGEIKSAKAGPDIHCPFCGSRNPSNQKICSRCGADLVEGKRRTKGKVIGDFNEKQVDEIDCSVCGTKNPITSSHCTKCGSPLEKGESLAAETLPDNEKVDKKKISITGKILGIALVVVICGFAVWLIFSLLHTQSITGTVKDVSWMRTIYISEYDYVTEEGWLSEIPDDALIGDCELKYHHTQDEPAPNSDEVCGTPYSVDQGSGYAEVVQDCEYRVYQDYCQYQIEDWVVIDQETLSGNDNIPEWPSPILSTDQRIDNQEESYSITFDTSKGNLVYKTDNYIDLDLFQPGTDWELEVNKFNAITSIE